MNRAQVSLEFIISILIILIIISFFISINLNFKEKIDTKINFKNNNTKICLIKNNYLELVNGEFINDDCKIKESTNNDT